MQFLFFIIIIGLVRARFSRPSILIVYRLYYELSLFWMQNLFFLIFRRRNFFKVSDYSSPLFPFFKNIISPPDISNPVPPHIPFIYFFSELWFKLSLCTEISNMDGRVLIMVVSSSVCRTTSLLIRSLRLYYVWNLVTIRSPESSLVSA